MEVTRTNRGFSIINHPTRDNVPKIERLVQESSAVGDYEDSFDKPGSSYLWFGPDHHLDREEVEELIGHLQRWLRTGSLMPKDGDDEPDEE